MEVVREDILEKKQELQRTTELCELQRNGQIDMEDDVVDDGVPTITIVESETRDIISEILSNHEDHVFDRPSPE